MFGRTKIEVYLSIPCHHRITSTTAHVFYGYTYIPDTATSQERLEAYNGLHRLMEARVVAFEKAHVEAREP